MQTVAPPRDGHTVRDVRNDRPTKSRDPAPRKGGKNDGAWGKGAWGVRGDEGSFALKPGDPMFEEPHSPHNTVGKWVVPTPTAEEFKPVAARILSEYIAGGDPAEVIVALGEANARDCGLEPELVKRSLLFALDRKQREREMISQLLASLREENVLEPESAADGFLLLLGDNSYLGDLALDTPDAIPALSQFVSRAIVDEVLFPSFLEHPAMAAAPPPQPGKEGAAASPSPGAAVIAGAKQLCSQHHASARISKIWGPGDGRPVAETKRAISLLLGEYLLGLDLDEATRCVRELERPHYLHEVVKQAILAAIDQAAEQAVSIVALLQHLHGPAQVLSSAQLRQGFERALERMEDLQLDVPDALSIFKSRFVAPAIEAGLIPATFNDVCIPMSDIKEKITGMIDEFFDNGETGIAEANRCLNEIAAAHLHGHIVKRLLNRAMGRTDRERQLASLLIFSWRRDDKMSAGAVHAGFASMLSNLGDVALDIPDARVHMQSFIGRAQHDGLLPDNWMVEES